MQDPQSPQQPSVLLIEFGVATPCDSWYSLPLGTCFGPGLLGFRSGSRLQEAGIPSLTPETLFHTWVGGVCYAALGHKILESRLQSHQVREHVSFDLP